MNSKYRFLLRNFYQFGTKDSAHQGDSTHVQELWFLYLWYFPWMPFVYAIKADTIAFF